VERWNHNTHYFPLLLDAVPAGATRALDVGCGEGTLARQLRQRIPLVTGIDTDEPTLQRAKAQGGDITYLQGDAMSYPFAEHSFDVVTCVAVLHWLGTEAGLTRLASLVAPGGMLGVIGLGRRDWPADLAWDTAGFLAHKVLARRHGAWNAEVPVADPPETHRDVKRIARRVLPGVRYRHHALFRHTLIWVASN
jgi:2-polyprenyl-3-methyl-5-hydroxy-6-metoxy-1,4-benzoquinol methylase